MHVLALAIVEAVFGGKAPAPALDDAGEFQILPHPTDAVAEDLAEHARWGAQAEALGAARGARAGGVVDPGGLRGQDAVEAAGEAARGRTGKGVRVDSHHEDRADDDRCSCEAGRTHAGECTPLALPLDCRARAASW